MKNKYTVIYVKSWQSGSHWHSLTKMARVEVDDDNLTPNLMEAVEYEDIQFVFVGWPPMVGEAEGGTVATG